MVLNLQISEVVTIIKVSRKKKKEVLPIMANTVRLFIVKTL